MESVNLSGWRRLKEISNYIVVLLIDLELSENNVTNKKQSNNKSINNHFDNRKVKRSQQRGGGLYFP